MEASTCVANIVADVAPQLDQQESADKRNKTILFAHVVVQVFFCPWTLEFKASISNAIQIYILQVFRGLYLKCKHVSYIYIYFSCPHAQP